MRQRAQTSDHGHFHGPVPNLLRRGTVVLRTLNNALSVIDRAGLLEELLG
jgi:hypothetical protein